MDARQTHGDRRKARPAAWATLAVVVVLTALPVAAGAAERVALVIGNADYDDDAADLKNPVNDADGMAEALEGLGFDVVLGKDLDRGEFYVKLNEFVKKASRGAGADVTLFFYAGHGLQVDGKNWLVPVDAKLESKLDLEHRAVKLDTVMDHMPGRHNLVFLDACRNNPLAVELARSMGLSRAVDAATRGLAVADRGSGRFIGYATAADDVAADGPAGDQNSPFTKALLSHIVRPGLSVPGMFQKVIQSVYDATGGRQVPWQASSLRGDPIYLASAAAPIPTPGGTGPAGGGTATTPPPPTTGDAARAAYEEAKELGTVAAYQIVVDDFHGTTYAKLAQTQIDELEGDTPEEVEQGLGLSTETKRLVQMGLAAAGHDPDRVDGLLGGKTRRALRAWQESKEVEATGYLTKEQGEVLAALGREESERRRAEAERERKAREAEERRRAEAERKAREAEERRRAEAERERKAREAEERRRAEAERKLKALKPRCPVESGQCWVELANMPSCHALVWRRETEKPAYKWWDGGCTDGLASGEGVLSYPGADGKDYRIGEGSYVDGKPHGRWTDYNGSDKWEGPYVDGKRHGQWTMEEIYEGKGRSVWKEEGGPYVDGKKHGQWSKYYKREGRKSSTMRSSEGPYVDDKKHGVWTFEEILDDEERTVREGPYVDGKKHGVWTETVEEDDRRICYEEEHFRGKIVKESDYYSC